MLESQEPMQGTVFYVTNLRKAWQKACAASGLGILEDVEGSYNKRYNGVIIHDLSRSAIRNLVAAGVSEKVAMSIRATKRAAYFTVITLWTPKTLRKQ
ncbi:MAG: hypothetical protein WCA38_12885 [Candidatus Acidiferrales bacterium]